MSNHFDLTAAARQEMIDNGFDPDFPRGTQEQLGSIKAMPAPAPSNGVKDLRNLLWSSIDNDTSRDLDQIEVAERVQGGIRVMVAVADVDSAVAKGTPIDHHASDQTTTVYTGVRNFPMLPDDLSTDLTSLNESEDRRAMVVDYVVTPDGEIQNMSIYRAIVRNHAQLAYNATGDWLEGKGEAPPKVAASADLQAQLKLQNEAAITLCQARHRHGALDFDRVETEVVPGPNHTVQELRERKRNLATRLIEDFMIGANECMARTLDQAGIASLRRVVRTPERWQRIVELAGRYKQKLPGDPDSAALNVFLIHMRDTDPVHYDDIALAVIKLMGPGEYIMVHPGHNDPGHFALAVQDYTHSTAPNRRFADLVTQRLIKSVVDKQPSPYSDGDLNAIAVNCTEKEDASRKVERRMEKRIAAVALMNKVGQTFHGVITGVTPKGTFVRIFQPPAEGLLAHGEQGVDVGDQVNVKLISTDPRHGFLDFARI